MDELPAELLSSIIAFCDRTTVFRLRGINKYFHNFITPLAFEHIYVGWQPKHFSYLERLAESPLAEHVRAVTVNTEFLPSWPNTDILWPMRDTICDDLRFEGKSIPDDWLGDYDEVAANRALRSKYSIYELATHRQLYNALHHNQSEVNNEMGKILVKALTMMENLQRLELIDKRGVYNEGTTRAQRSEGPLGACSPGKNLFIDPYSWNARLRNHMRHMAEENNEGFLTCSALALHSIAEAFALHPDRSHLSYIKELTLGVGHYFPIFDACSYTHVVDCDRCWDWGLEFVESTVTRRAVFSLLESLTRLSLHMNHEQFHHSKAVCHELAQVLIHAKNVRHLELDNRGSGCVDFFAEIAALISAKGRHATPWPFLKHLCISAETIRQKELTTILGAAGQSLHTLDLAQIESNPDDLSSG